MQKHSRKNGQKAEETAPSAEEIETMLKVLNRAYRQTQEGMASSTRSAAKYAFQNTCTWFTERHIAFSLEEKTGLWKLETRAQQSEDSKEHQ